MEKEIKILEEMKKDIVYDSDEDYDNQIAIRQIQAIENLIKGYRELEEENKRLKMHRPIRFVPSINDNKSWYSPYKKY